MTQDQTPQCGDWLKLVESLAFKRHYEDGEQVCQGDSFRFLGLSAAEGFCECYAPRLKSRFWIKLDYLHPIQDLNVILSLEIEMPAQFKYPTDKIRAVRRFNDVLVSLINQWSVTHEMMCDNHSAEL